MKDCLSCKSVFQTNSNPTTLVYKCRRFPPSHDHSAGAHKTALFPTVISGYWCDEYVPKEQLKADQALDASTDDAVDSFVDNLVDTAVDSLLGGEKKRRGRPKKS